MDTDNRFVHFNTSRIVKTVAYTIAPCLCAFLCSASTCDMLIRQSRPITVHEFNVPFVEYEVINSTAEPLLPYPVYIEMHRLDETEPGAISRVYKDLRVDGFSMQVVPAGERIIGVQTYCDGDLDPFHDSPYTTKVFLPPGKYSVYITYHVLHGPEWETVLCTLNAEYSLTILPADEQSRREVEAIRARIRSDGRDGLLKHYDELKNTVSIHAFEYLITALRDASNSFNRPTELKQRIAREILYLAIERIPDSFTGADAVLMILALIDINSGKKVFEKRLKNDHEELIELLGRTDPGSLAYRFAVQYIPELRKRE